MDSLFDRRSWLRWCLKGSCFAGLGGVGYAGLSFLRADAPAFAKRDDLGGAPEPQEDGDEGEPSDAQPALGSRAEGPREADEIPVGGSKMIALGSTPVIVVRLESGLKAFGAVCSHLGCLVKWNPSTRTFDCPCHNGKYDSDGRVIAGPPPRELVEYPLASVGLAPTVATRAAGEPRGSGAG